MTLSTMTATAQRATPTAMIWTMKPILGSPPSLTVPGQAKGDTISIVMARKSSSILRWLIARRREESAGGMGGSQLFLPVAKRQRTLIVEIIPPATRRRNPKSRGAGR